jgi:integrase
VNPTNLRKRSFKPLLKNAGLPPIRFHDLRHTCATLLLSSNVNLTSSLDVGARYYCHNP